MCPHERRLIRFSDKQCNIRSSACRIKHRYTASESGFSNNTSTGTRASRRMCARNNESFSEGTHPSIKNEHFRGQLCGSRIPARAKLTHTVSRLQTMAPSCTTLVLIWYYVGVPRAYYIDIIPTRTRLVFSYSCRWRSREGDADCRRAETYCKLKIYYLANLLYSCVYNM